MDWTLFNWVDGLFVAVLLYGAAMGAVRGFSHELATLIGMVVAVVVTRLFYEPVSAWICGRWGWDPEITRLAAVAGIAVLALFGMRMLRLALGTLMTFSFKGPVERIGGLLAGFFRMGVIFSVCLLVAYFLPSAWVQREVDASRMSRPLLPYLVQSYNTLAEKAALLQADIPVGVALPQTVMPPLPEEGEGLLQAVPMFPSEE